MRWPTLSAAAGDGYEMSCSSIATTFPSSIVIQYGDH